MSKRTIKEIDPNYQVSWYRTPLSRETLRALNVRSDLKGFGQAGGYLLCIIASAGLLAYAFTSLHWGWWLVAMFIHGNVTGFTYNAIHELVHGTVFRTKWLNDAFAWIFTLIGMWNFHAFWASHAEHHKYTLHDPEDSEVLVPISHSFKGFLLASTFNWGTLKWLFSTNLSLARGIPVSEWDQHLFSKKELREKIFNCSRITLLVHALVLLIAIFSGWWWLPIITTLHVCYFKGLPFLMNETQHIGLQDHVDDFRLNSRTFLCNPVFGFLYWNMNYHIEHHMYAGVPCYNLRKLHQQIRHELPYCFKGLVETWAHIITCIYRQNHEDGYVYVPVIPGGDKAEEVGVRAVREQNPGQANTPMSTPRAVEGGSQRKQASAIPFKTWECGVCGFIYSEEIGLPLEGIAPGTRWEDIPDDWCCPDCGVAKADFSMQEIEVTNNVENFPTTVDLGGSEPIVFLGCGLASIQTISEFRKLNRVKPILVLTDDSGDSYYKPYISNALASGKNVEDLRQKTALMLEHELNIEIKPGAEIREINPLDKKVQLASGETISYSRLVFALGARPKPFPHPGTLSVNSLADYGVFLEHLPKKGHVAIIGAGLVGCEFANDLASSNYSVSVIEPADRPLAALATVEQSEMLRAALAEQGVEWHLGVGVDDIQDGKEVILSTGQLLKVDVILSAIGLLPNINLAQAAGLQCGRGICVDNFLRGSIKDHYALGDCAEINGRCYPFVEPLRASAQALARTLSGVETAVDFKEHKVTLKAPACPLEFTLSVPKPQPSYLNEYQTQP